MLKQPELARDERFSSNSRRTAARNALEPIILAAFAPFTADQVVARLEAAGIANARMNDMHEVWAHPQLHARHRCSTVTTTAGNVPTLVPPGIGTDSSPRMDPVPALGAHTDSILGELGWSNDDIARLRAAGAI